jgi:hypothetical protein
VWTALTPGPEFRHGGDNFPSPATGGTNLALLNK